MAHAKALVTPDDIKEIVKAEPVTLSRTQRAILLLLFVFGVLSFFGELFTGDSRYAWVSLQVNFTYWFAVAAAMSCFAAVFTICNAQWARPIARLFQSATPFFMWSPLFLVVLYFGHEHLFVWSHHEVPGKGAWLSPVFVYLRDIAAIVLLVYFARKLIYFSVRRDIGAIRDGLTGVSEEDASRWADASYDRYVSGWSGDSNKEISQATSKMSRLSPVVVIIYSISMSLIAYDQLMSVDPHWYSTMFGGFYFMSAVYLAVAWVAMAIGMSREIHPLFRSIIHPSTLHDLGKLVFGFGIFWAYLFWSHYLPIWYGNLPEETGWIILRLRAAPWRDIAWIVLGSAFIIPFLLGLSRDVKQVPILLFATGAIVALGLWLQQYLLFVPSLYPNELPFRLVDLGIGLGIMSIYIFSAVHFLSRVPLVPFGDLCSKPSE